MFTFIVCKWLKLKDDGAKIVMVLIAIYVDSFAILVVLEGLGILK